MYPSLAFGTAVDALDLMVVDENRGMQRILAAVLMASGLRRVRTPSDSGKALDDMINMPPDILIVDWSLRDSDAETLIRTMRTAAMHPLCLVPVICLSFQASRADIVTILDAGATTVLRKPVSTSDLLEHIRWITRDSRPFHMDGHRFVQAQPKKLIPEAERDDDVFAI